MMLINRNNTALCRTVSYYTILCDTTITYTVSDILHCPVLYYFLLCCSEAHCGFEEIPYLHISHLLSLTLTLSLSIFIYWYLFLHLCLFFLSLSFLSPFINTLTTLLPFCIYLYHFSPPLLLESVYGYPSARISLRISVIYSTLLMC